jgi:virginiamycin A acetyltransferase
MPVTGFEERFPFMQIDKDSYIVGAEIQSGLNFNIAQGVHCVQIGKYCALADKITFYVNLNHNYKSIFQGSPSFMTAAVPDRTKRKGSVLIGNDVWIGNGVSIMSGVSIHNGAVIGAESVVTKSVPSYAMAAGNPAKIIGYRFDEEQRRALNRIAWWNWTEEKLIQNQKEFLLPVEDFTQKFDQREEWDQIKPVIPKTDRKTLLLIADYLSPFSLWKRILTEYGASGPADTTLLLYIGPSAGEEGYRQVLAVAEKLEADGRVIIVRMGTVEDDIRCLFAAADYFITTRSEENILFMEYADYYQAKLLYGTDIPVFTA